MKLTWLAVGMLSCFIGYGIMTPGEVQSGGRGQGFRPCPYSPYHCPVQGKCIPGDITGKIKRVFTESLKEGMYPGMVLEVETAKKGLVCVQLGPVWYLERQEMDLNVGDEVRIKGICDQSGDPKRLVAAEVTKGDNVLILRDAEGRPNWEAWRRR